MIFRTILSDNVRLEFTQAFRRLLNIKEYFKSLLVSLVAEKEGLN